MLRFYGYALLLHGYIGWRLLPDMPSAALGWAMALWLAASMCLVPLGLVARRIRTQPLSDALSWAGLLAIGSFSSLLVLTFIRDLALLCGSALLGWAIEADALKLFQSWSAIAVPTLAALFTIVGLVNARRLARVRSIDVPIAGLPASLHGFTIA